LQHCLNWRFGSDDSVGIPTCCFAASSETGLTKKTSLKNKIIKSKKPQFPEALLFVPTILPEFKHDACSIV
jgi:hypothetical protein